GLVLVHLDLVQVEQVEDRQEHRRHRGGGREKVEAGQSQEERAPTDQGPAEYVAAAVGRVGEEGRDHAQVIDVRAGRGRENLGPAPVARAPDGEVGATVAAVL